MAWLDDRVWCHPKLVGLSDAAFRAYVNSITYAAGMGTRGHLSCAQIKLISAKKNSKNELLSAGLWDEVDDGIAIHDWDTHNGKRDERRAKDRARKRIARAKDSPQDIPQELPQDSPQAAPQERRALKEVKVVTESKANASLSRQPDEIWDALAVELGEPQTRSERGRRNVAVKELRDIGATGDEVRKRAARYRRVWPGVTLTANALAANWSTFGDVNGPPIVAVEDVVALPDLSPDEVALNLERIQELAQSIGHVA